MNDANRPNVLIVAGAGEYSDPWHPFAETSAQLQSILSERYDTTLVTDVAKTLAELRAGEWDLVVLNFGSAGVAVATDAACVDGIVRYTRAGGPLLVSHVTATVFPADERWEHILGGRWVRGTTMHPPYGSAEVSLVPVEHEVTGDLQDFALMDERYSFLRVSEDVEILATHRHDDIDHALVWAHESESSRVVYDGLGHDARSYDSPEHRALVLNAAEWLLATADED